MTKSIIDNNKVIIKRTRKYKLHNKGDYQDIPIPITASDVHKAEAIADQIEQTLENIKSYGQRLRELRIKLGVES